MKKIILFTTILFFSSCSFLQKKEIPTQEPEIIKKENIELTSEYEYITKIESFINNSIDSVGSKERKLFTYSYSERSTGERINVTFKMGGIKGYSYSIEINSIKNIDGVRVDENFTFEANDPNILLEQLRILKIN